MSYGDGGFWFTQPTGYGALDLQGSSYGMADPASTVLTPSAVEISDPEPEWECIGCAPSQQPGYQPPVAPPGEYSIPTTLEEKEGLKDWQKAVAVVALVLWAIRKR